MMVNHLKTSVTKIMKFTFQGFSTIILLIILILFTFTVNVECVNNQKIDLSEQLEFIYMNTAKNTELENRVFLSFSDITKKFQLKFEDRIKIIIFNTQNEFWDNVFPEKENNNSTTGFADVEKKIIYLTSPEDNSIKTREEMLKVPTHELVHILLPHPWIDIREGLAVYLADQIQSYSADEIPDNLNSIISYKGSAEKKRRSYTFAGLKIKFIIEECLENDFEKFMEFISTPEKDLDYERIGFNNETEFLNAFREYLGAGVHK